MHAIDTSGRAVLFAGGTVVISLLGLFVIGVSFIRGLAIGAVARGAVRDGRRGHAAARGARVRRPHDRQVRAPERASGASRSRAASGRAGAARCRRGRGRRRSAGSLVLLVLAVPFFSLAARRRRRRQRPDEAHDPARLRPALAGVRAGDQRPAADRRRCAPPPTLPTANRLRTAIAADPDVAQVSPRRSAAPRAC